MSWLAASTSPRRRGAAYRLRALEPFTWLTIPWMAAVHGTLNSFGFVLAGLVGWTLVQRRNGT